MPLKECVQQFVSCFDDCLLEKLLWKKYRTAFPYRLSFLRTVFRNKTETRN